VPGHWLPLCLPAEGSTVLLLLLPELLQPASAAALGPLLRQPTDNESIM
jgi:hypothetical protein